MKDVIKEFADLLRKHETAILEHGKATGLRARATILKSFFMAVAYAAEKPSPKG